jgi:hypothetical protein
MDEAGTIVKRISLPEIAKEKLKESRLQLFAGYNRIGVTSER